MPPQRLANSSLASEWVRRCGESGTSVGVGGVDLIHQERHLHGTHGGFVALVVVAGARTVESLLIGVHGEHTEHDRHAGIQLRRTSSCQQRLEFGRGENLGNSQ